MKKLTLKTNLSKNEIKGKSAITSREKSRTEKILNVISQRRSIQSNTYENLPIDRFIKNLKKDIIDGLPDQFSIGALDTYHGVLFVFITTDTNGEYYEECCYVVEPDMELDICDTNLFAPVTEMIIHEYSHNYDRTAHLGDGIKHYISVYLFEEIDDDDDDDDEADDEDEYED